MYPQRTYSRYENDERAIPIEVFSKLADFYNTSVDYLIGRTNVKDSIRKLNRILFLYESSYHRPSLKLFFISIFA